MGIKVVVAEKELSIAKKISNYLQAKGFDCESVCTVKEAMAKIRKGADLLIWDLRFPCVNGIDVIKFIKQHQLNIPVIITSTLKDLTSARKVFKEGAVDYITKPIHYNDLENSIAYALQKKDFLVIHKELKKQMEEELELTKQKIKTQYLNNIIGLIKMIEERDGYTKGHSQRVSNLAVGIAEHMSLNKNLITKIKIAGLLHDIGIIAVPDSVLHKPEALAEEEMEIIKKHPECGVVLLEYFIDDSSILEMIRHHHENWDGRGYPWGLKGKEIPLGSRILAISNSYDAMISPRPFRDKLEPEEAVERIKKASGSMFDPEVVGKSIDVLHKLKLSKC